MSGCLPLPLHDTLVIPHGEVLLFCAKRVIEGCNFDGEDEFSYVFMIFSDYIRELVTIFTKLGNYVCKEGDSYACNALIKH